MGVRTGEQFRTAARIFFFADYSIVNLVITPYNEIKI